MEKEVYEPGTRQIIGLRDGSWSEKGSEKWLLEDPKLLLKIWSTIGLD